MKYKCTRKNCKWRWESKLNRKPKVCPRCKNYNSVEKDLTKKNHGKYINSLEKRKRGESPITGKETICI